LPWSTQEDIASAWKDYLEATGYNELLDTKHHNKKKKNIIMNIIALHMTLQTIIHRLLLNGEMVTIILALIIVIDIVLMMISQRLYTFQDITDASRFNQNG
jgi:accessory gene regulator protein AgrB